MLIFLTSAADRAKSQFAMPIVYAGERTSIIFENGTANVGRELGEFLIETRRGAVTANFRGWAAALIVEGARRAAAA